MSLAATCGWTLLRTLLLCLLAWPICRLIERSLICAGERWRPLYLTAVLIPSCFPELLVGYAFRDLALGHPRWAEFLCSGLLLVRIIPVGTIALLAAPRPVLDSTAIYCRRLAFRSRFGQVRDWAGLANCYWHGPIVRALPALALMSIVAFQEFEMAALLQTISWTDWFVTAERLGLERQEMLIQSLWPLLMQIPVLVGVLCWMRLQPEGPVEFAAEMEVADIDTRRRLLRLGLACVGVCLVSGCVIPLGLISWRTFEGFAMFWSQRPLRLGLMREMITSGTIAICAGFASWTLSGRFRGAWANLMLLGLFGSMLLSLGFVVLFQQSWLNRLYDTPIPWGLALTVWLLPRAAILRLWLRMLRNDQAIHVAQMLAGNGLHDRRRSRNRSTLLWNLRGQPQFLAVSVLCFWAYCDLPTAYLLAPSGMASGLVRLYNFMHFGRSAALSVEASLFFGIPISCVLLFLLANRKLR